MTKDEIEAWSKDPRRADTLPFGLLESTRHLKPIAGAALVVRGVVYFRNGFKPDVRKMIAQCFEQYLTVIMEYQNAVAVAAGVNPSKDAPLQWTYTEGHAPIEYNKAPTFDHLAQTVPADKSLVVSMTSAEDKRAAGFFDFSVFALSDWKSELYPADMDGFYFTVPRAFLVQRPGFFQAMFATFVQALPTIYGHAGLAVNIPPMDRRPNEAGEYFYARLFGPGIDVGYPLYSSIRGVSNKIKTVDWIVALDKDLVKAVGGDASLTLPPDWYIRKPLPNGGLLIQAGIAPDSGISEGKEKPIIPPAAYVLLNKALNQIVSKTLDILQDGTVNSTAPLLNTNVATEAWLRRFDVPDDKLNGFWLELHKTQKVTADRVAIEELTQKFLKRMVLPERPAS